MSSYTVKKKKIIQNTSKTNASIIEQWILKTKIKNCIEIGLVESFKRLP